MYIIRLYTNIYNYICICICMFRFITYHLQLITICADDSHRSNQNIGHFSHGPTAPPRPQSMEPPEPREGG